VSGKGHDEKVGRRAEKVPRRVIHCSDGVVEEYSTDDDDDDDDDQVDAANSKPTVDPVIHSNITTGTVSVYK